MLVLRLETQRDRRNFDNPNATVLVGQVAMTILSTERGRVRVGFAAPRSIPILSADRMSEDLQVFISQVLSGIADPSEIAANSREFFHER